ncbi:hypothetical protein NQ314_021354 [Rhamnusium bicolor]|uniref:Rieske domain-containing protein n=1 Tax=Rhamnusium bicolor TaxID=1586634 RepID=A0AAV8WJD6_9CUCU|nr:hypothetical protein NQ314_021354 [Rhamnusium bicolor]
MYTTLTIASQLFKASQLHKYFLATSADQEDPEDYVEDVVCQISDLNENELKTFDLDEGKVLLVKQNGKINALGTKCTHYGAPLVNSAIGDGRLRCQWHGACFSLATGDIEDFPELNQWLRGISEKGKKIVVIGGGPAGATCVEALRQEGYTGQLTLVCKENCLPYDRVKVSKAMDFEIEKAEFRDDKFYKEHDIEVAKGIEATAVDTIARTVTLSNGKQLEYDKLFIATGCKARKVDIPGANLPNVVVLRDYEHSKYTNAQLEEDKEVVVLGSSFIAMEAANYCLNKVKKVTVILRGDVPFKPLLGSDVGAAFMNLFKEKGVNFITRSGMTKVNEDCKGNVVSVELNDGKLLIIVFFFRVQKYCTTLRADLVIMGVGSTFYTDFLKSSGIDIKEDGTIETDEYLETNVPGIYVGGDIAYAPVWSHNNMKAAIGHYPLAHYHGKIAALNMLGKRNVEEYKFVAFYLKDDEVVATSSCGMDPVVSQFAEHLSQGKKLFRDDIKEDPLAWTKK